MLYSSHLSDVIFYFQIFKFFRKILDRHVESPSIIWGIASVIFRYSYNSLLDTTANSLRFCIEKADIYFLSGETTVTFWANIFKELKKQNY